MEDAKSFSACLEATKAILAATAGKDGHAAILVNEMAELTEMLQRIPLRGKEAADVIHAIKAAKFHEENEEALIAVVAKVLSEAPKALPRGLSKTGPLRGDSRGGPRNQGIEFQDFEAIVHYIPQQVWLHTQKSQSGVGILKTAVALGLRRGTEKTYRALSLAILCAAKGLENVVAMSPAARTTDVKTIKPQVLQMGGLVGGPAVWLDKLPATPQELQASQPDLYASVYGQAAPASNPFDHIQWNLLVAGTKCR